MEVQEYTYLVFMTLKPIQIKITKKKNIKNKGALYAGSYWTKANIVKSTKVNWLNQG